MFEILWQPGDFASLYLTTPIMSAKACPEISELGDKRTVAVMWLGMEHFFTICF